MNSFENDINLFSLKLIELPWHAQVHNENLGFELINFHYQGTNLDNETCNCYSA